MDDTVGKLFSDEYSRKARLFPAILAAVPYALILSYFIQSYFLASQVGWVKVLCVGLGSIAFSTVAALWFGVSTVYWLGKVIEVNTFKNGVGFPTTEFLLWKDKTLSRQFKEKLREKIFNDFGVRLFTVQQEDADCDEAKKTIRDAVDLIRPRVGNGKFVLQYNIRYGFIRNFIAGSFFAAPSSLKVRNLVMNRPWDYIDELYELVKDGRITKESLEQTLRRKYKFIDELEQLAAKKGCNIVKGVRDSLLESELKIMSPTKDFYIARIAESEKTPKMDLAVENKGFARRVCDALREWIAGIWGIDAIKDGESTSAENETSIILYVKPEGESPFLYTGDAGCMALTEALDYGDAINCKLSECDFVQMPHHGGRHNVGPSILDRLIGPKVGEDVDAKKTSFVSVGKNSDHPRKCVVNAFINRGCRVFVCSTKTLCHHSGQVPDRKWVAASPEKFSEQVEK